MVYGFKSFFYSVSIVAVNRCYVFIYLVSVSSVTNNVFTSGYFMSATVLIHTVHLMENILHSLKKHALSITFYLIYDFLWYTTLKPVEKRMTDEGSLGAAGIFTSLIFIILSFIKALRTKDQYYPWLILFVDLPVIIAFMMWD